MAVALLACSPGRAAESHLRGNISNITTFPGGMLVMLDTGMPANCAGSPFGWMLIPEGNKTMVATALAMWFSSQRSVVAYTSAYTGNGYCTITQLDPN